VLDDRIIVLSVIAYLGLLFAVAYWGDKRADAGRSVIDNPTVYALSMAVYATSWTFYGSVGRAAADGVSFLTIYLGPTLAAVLWGIVLRKMIRISKTHRITSIADFIGARYGKSSLLGGLVTVIAAVGVLPYIALQLKAVSTSFELVHQYPVVAMPDRAALTPLGDTALYVALLMAAFTIVFGTRHLDATERHEGMVAAIAFESVVKLVAFLAVGVFVTYGLYDGFGDLFKRAAARVDAPWINMPVHAPATYGSWASLNFLSMLAVLMLPRQFQIGVVENVNEAHVARATWLFPAYLLAINVFVIPIALAGLMELAPRGIVADTFVLTLPMAHGHETLALLVFIGGLSASTGMVIVETIALSTMICNDLVMPILLRSKRLALARRAGAPALLLNIRRVSIVLLMVMGYAYYRAAGEAYALVSIGLVSFAAVAQFAPALLGGMYWREGTRNGAVCGLVLGFGLWLYTLLLPSFAKSGWLGMGFVDDGPAGIAMLKPQALLGVHGLDPISHALFWSLLCNAGAYVLVSLWGRQGIAERSQARLFVDVIRVEVRRASVWRGRTTVKEMHALVARFLGEGRAREAFAAHAQQQGAPAAEAAEAGPALLLHVENLLAGVIGAASARIMLASIVKEEPLDLEEVLGILDETSQVIAYSRQIEKKSKELERATIELRAANARLQELDRLKDDFISTVTHELRTPLTSIRAFSEILQRDTDLAPERRAEFVGIIVQESERLTRLINQVLDLSKLDSGVAQWHPGELRIEDVVADALKATGQLVHAKGATVHARWADGLPTVRADRDRLMQVLVNLLSNAIKFCPAEGGRIDVTVKARPDALQVDVQDNGPGVRAADQQLIFEKFTQVSDESGGRPAGTGLGLPISRRIVQHSGGRLWVRSTWGEGATFSFTLPLTVPAPVPRTLETEA
jgi:Na+/proline symporter/nitrogen-specific signal transduction histidine kinase